MRLFSIIVFFSVATSTFPTPLGAYLGCTFDNLNTVDIWIESHPFHGIPLVKVSQTSGSFAPSSMKAFSLPLTGWANLYLYTTNLINIYIQIQIEHPKIIILS